MFFSGFFPTAVPDEENLTFCEQKSTLSWKMASELTLPKSQVSCALQAFFQVAEWGLVHFSLLPMIYLTQQML